MAQNGDSLGAEKRFESIKEYSATQHNLLVLRHDIKMSQGYQSARPADELCNEPFMSGWQSLKAVHLSNDYAFYCKKNECYKAYMIRKKDSQYRVLVQKTNDSNQLTLSGFGVGSLLSKVHENLEEKFIKNGFFACCREKGLFFQTNLDKIIQEWGIFLVLSP